MQGNDVGKIVENIPKSFDFKFSEHTTYGLGGRARIAYYPETVSDACALFDYLNKNNEKPCILGCGSNILASDDGYDGAVISTKSLNKIFYRNGYLYCQSGVKVSKLLKYCKSKGLSGLEYLAGIPASLGGLSFMNGGISSRHIGNDIISVTIFDGKLRKFSNSDCNFVNKHSTMRDINCLILSLKLKITQKTPEIVGKNIEEFLKKRAKLPRGKSCGCVFKNTDGGVSAGKIIEDCGLKGIILGSAKVSVEHANFIPNEGSSAGDIYKLVKFIKSEVLARTGILLREEVVYIGKFNDSDS